MRRELVREITTVHEPDCHLENVLVTSSLVVGAQMYVRCPVKARAGRPIVIGGSAAHLLRRPRSPYPKLAAPVFRSIQVYYRYMDIIGRHPWVNEGGVAWFRTP